jgi:SulP family sulfate permease
VRRFRPHWPALLIAVVLTAVMVWLLGLEVETIGSRFGGIPNTLPAPHFPEISMDKVLAVLPDAIAFALLFLHRMAQTVGIETVRPVIEADRADTVGGDGRTPYDSGLATSRDVIVYRISGAFFFGAAATIGTVLDRLAEHPKAYVLDVSAVPLLDSTAAATIAGFARTARRRGATVYITGAARPIRRVLLTHGARPPYVRYRSTVADAVEAARTKAQSPQANEALANT